MESTRPPCVILMYGSASLMLLVYGLDVHGSAA